MPKQNKKDVLETRQFSVLFPARIWAMLSVIRSRRSYGSLSFVVFEGVEELYKREVGDPQQIDPLAEAKKLGL